MEAKDFLEKNGFIESIIIPNRYNKGKNFVEIRNRTFENGEYRVYIQENGSSMYSKDLNIYWLIGVLTYYGLIDKNYKK